MSIPDSASWVAAHSVPFDTITAVCVIPFTASGDLVTIVQVGGADIPGGHVQEHETSAKQAGRREAMEEAAITLGDLLPVGFLESPVPAQGSKSATYIAILTGFVDELRPLSSASNAGHRRVITIQEFLDMYSGKKQLMRLLVKRARILLFPKSS